MTADLYPYLQPTFFLDSDTEIITTFTEQHCSAEMSLKEKAVKLYYAVRDSIRYDPFDLRYDRQAMKASSVLQKQSGYCVSKAVVLAAAARRQAIPSRLGFADVTNHLSTPKLRSKMGTDLFVYHGYTEMYIDGKWVKATPAFNLTLCTRFNVKPLDFTGTEDSIFHEYDTLGKKHMEYVKDHGHFADLPFERIFSAYNRTYPSFFENFSGSDSDFEMEAAQQRG